MNVIGMLLARTLLRFELIDRPEDGYRAPSMEELRAAMVSDQRMEDDNLLQVPMDITITTGNQVIIFDTSTFCRSLAFIVPSSLTLTVCIRIRLLCLTLIRSQ